MTPVKLRLTNFISHSDTEIDFTDISALCLYGDNGAGKTSIIDGILYALYSRTSRGKDESLIRSGERKLQVELSFEVEGRKYLVKKEKEFGKPKEAYLYLVEDEATDLLATGERVDHYIENLLGMDYNTFTSTCFLLQDNAYKFILATPSDRYRVLFDILGLEVYQDYKKTASSLKREMEGKVSLLENQIGEKKAIVEGKQEIKKGLEEVKDALKKLSERKKQTEMSYIKGEKELSSLSASLSELQKQIKADLPEEISKTRDKVRQYEKILQKRVVVQSALQERADLNQEMTRLFEEEKEILKKYEGIRDKLFSILQAESNVRSSLDAAKSAAERCLLEVEKNKSRLDEFQEVSKLVDVVPCKAEGEFASCMLIYNAVKSRKEIPTLQEQLRQLSAKADEYNQIVLARKKELDDMISIRKQVEEDERKLAKQLKEVQTVKTKLQRRLEELEKLCNLQSQIASAEKALEAEVEKLKNLEQEMERIKQLKAKEEQMILKLRETERMVKTLEQQVYQLEVEEKTLKDKASELEAKLKICEEQEKEVKSLTLQLDEFRKKAFIYSLLEEAYDKIPRIMFANYLAAFEDKVNEILNRLSDTGMQIALVTERQAKTTKAVKNTLDIIVSDVAGERPIGNFSGGEKTRLALATTVALSELASQKGGRKVLTLVVDEPPGLDMQGHKDFAMTVNQLIKEGMFAKCIVISHSGELIDEFHQKIRVEKNGEGISQVFVEKL